MKVQEQINEYINTLSDIKSSELRTLHQRILKLQPRCKLWYLDGINSEGKIVSNPNIGYGAYTIQYADGKTKEFYQVGLSANTTGISVYIMGIADKMYLTKNYGKELGKASVSGYCIKFKSIKDINLEVLEAAIRFGFVAKG